MRPRVAQISRMFYQLKTELGYKFTLCVRANFHIEIASTALL
jgi:hypothetical protein